MTALGLRDRNVQRPRWARAKLASLYNLFAIAHHMNDEEYGLTPASDGRDLGY